MKTILTTIILAANCMVCFAQWQQGPQRGGGPNPYPDRTNTRQGNNYNMQGSLVVRSASQEQFAVSVDNNQYQSNGNTTINIGQLYAGNHNVVIYEWRRNFWGKQVQKAIYNTTLNVRQGFETSLFLNTNGQVSVSERQIYNNNNQQGGYGNNGNGVGYGYGRDKNKHKKNHHKDHDDDDDRDYRGNDRDRYDRK